MRRSAREIRDGEDVGARDVREGVPCPESAHREQRGDEGGREREGDKSGDDGPDKTGDFCDEDGEASQHCGAS